MSEDFIGKLLSRIAERADRETVSSDGLRLSGDEFLGLVEYAAEAMSGDLGVSAGDVVAYGRSKIRFASLSATRHSRWGPSSFTI